MSQTTPPDASPPQPVELLAADATPAQLRTLLRTHLTWLFGASGVAILAMALPSHPWWIAVPRFLLFAFAFLTAFTRLLQVNGIAAELRAREARLRQTPPAVAADEDTDFD